MSTGYAAGLGRPPFVVGGRVVARRDITLSGKVYEPGEDVPTTDLTPRQIAVLWEQGTVDTMPIASAAPARAPKQAPRADQSKPAT